MLDNEEEYWASLLAQEPPTQEDWTQEALEEVNNLPSVEEQRYKNTRKGQFRPLREFQEQEAQWLIPGYLPQGQITLLASDGGIGKTTLTALQETVLFSIDENGLPEVQGTTFQRDRDFVQQCATASLRSICRRSIRQHKWG
jgi:hypothetical protein